MVSILFRNQNEDEEYEASKKYFTSVPLLTLLPPNDLVIGRYSVLPYYKELEDNLSNLAGWEVGSPGSRLVNSYKQHKFIADFEYYEHISDLTAETYTFGTMDWAKAVDDGKGWVVKGATNSFKFLWNTRCYAKDKFEANKIAVELQRDSLIGTQKILMRRYLPFKKVGEGINGLPILNEWRLFWLYGKLVDFGYYWATHDETEECYTAPGCFEVAERAYRRIAPYCNFVAIDVAELEDGEWKVVEVNDGQMSGLSNIPPERFYENLRNALGV